ncbi:hypothetical protein Tco_1575328 [Tanacetum coccineum]
MAIIAISGVDVLPYSSDTPRRFIGLVLGMVDEVVVVGGLSTGVVLPQGLTSSVIFVCLSVAAVIVIRMAEHGVVRDDMPSEVS